MQSAAAPPSPKATSSVPSNMNASAPPARAVSVSGTVSNGPLRAEVGRPIVARSKRETTIAADHPPADSSRTAPCRPDETRHRAGRPLEPAAAEDRARSWSCRRSNRRRTSGYDRPSRRAPVAVRRVSLRLHRSASSDPNTGCGIDRDDVERRASVQEARSVLDRASEPVLAPRDGLPPVSGVRGTSRAMRHPRLPRRLAPRRPRRGGVPAGVPDALRPSVAASAEPRRRPRRARRSGPACGLPPDELGTRGQRARRSSRSAVASLTSSTRASRCSRWTPRAGYQGSSGRHSSAASAHSSSSSASSSAGQRIAACSA